MVDAVVKCLRTSIAATAAALLVAAPGAWASHTTDALSDEAGWPCTATESRAGWTLLASPQAGWSISPLVKQHRAVITSWNVRVGPGLGPLAQQLSVFRQVSSDIAQYTKVAESAVETFGNGTEAVATRIPVQGGDLVGLHGPAATFVCGGEESTASALFEGPVGLGETRTFKIEAGVRPPVSATVEIDADGDGYGDASQDDCPESAHFQTPCPIVALSIGDVEVKRRAILIEVSVNSTASVEASGEVCWSVRRKAGSRANRSTLRKSCQEARVGLETPNTLMIDPGAPVTLRVPLPQTVRTRLDRIKPRGSLRARIDLVGTNLVPNTGTQELRVRLPGRAKPQQPR